MSHTPRRTRLVGHGSTSCVHHHSDRHRGETGRYGMLKRDARSPDLAPLQIFAWTGRQKRSVSPRCSLSHVAGVRPRSWFTIPVVTDEHLHRMLSPVRQLQHPLSYVATRLDHGQVRLLSRLVLAGTSWLSLDSVGDVAWGAPGLRHHCPLTSPSRQGSSESLTLCVEPTSTIGCCCRTARR